MLHHITVRGARTMDHSSRRHPNRVRLQEGLYALVTVTLSAGFWFACVWVATSPR